MKKTENQMEDWGLEAQKFAVESRITYWILELHTGQKTLNKAEQIVLEAKFGKREGVEV